MSYAGYGFDPGGHGCPPHPVEALVECLRAMQQVLEDTLQIADLASWIHPPFHAKWVNGRVRAVISTTVGLNAVTNAAGLALQAANSSIVAVPIFEMTSATDGQAIFQVTPPRSHMARIASWGISVEGGPPELVQVRVKAPSQGGLPTAPDPFLSSHESSQQQPTFLILQENQQLTIEVLLNVTTMPALINFGISYWQWPITRRTDTKEGASFRSGYGVECRR
jgi:hypothetical protein